MDTSSWKGVLQRMVVFRDNSPHLLKPAYTRIMGVHSFPHTDRYFFNLDMYIGWTKSNARSDLMYASLKSAWPELQCRRRRRRNIRSSVALQKDRQVRRFTDRLDMASKMYVALPKPPIPGYTVLNVLRCEIWQDFLCATFDQWVLSFIIYFKDLQGFFNHLIM